MHLWSSSNILRRAGSLTKTLLIMKFTAIFLLGICLQVNANSYAQKISLSERNTSIEKVFKTIERQSGYLFWYEYSLLRQASRITVSARNLSLTEALDLCLKDQPLSYSIVKNTIVITKKEERSVEEAPAPQIEVSGQVTDSTGAPLEGVSVAVVGVNRGVTTDQNGNFRLEVSPDATLRFSLISYQTIDIPLQNRTTINVVMRLANSSLTDVVVVGYGTLSRRDITGAVSSITTQGIENQPVASVDQAIAGQAAGVRVVQTTGTPGGGLTIRVRGTGSISAGNEPLYVIDGFPIEGGYSRDMNPLATLNPNEIESIQVLKDASAAAIYGSRGSNGVVLVTTKRGKAGKPRVSLDAYYGIQNVSKKIDMLNAREYALYNIESRNNAWVDAGGNANDPNSVRPDRLKIPPMFENPESLGEGTDWQDEIFRTSPVQNYQIGVSGGNDKTQYMLSGGYFNQEGVVIHTGFERFSFRFNIDTRISDRIKIGASLAPSYSRSNRRSVEDQVFGGGIIGSALAMPPTVPVYNPDGSFTTLLTSSPYNIGILDNPVAIASKVDSRIGAYRTLGNLFAEWEIIDGLTLRSSVGGDLYEDRINYYAPSDLGRNGVPAPVSPEAESSSQRVATWLNENTLTYDKTFNGKHRLIALAGITSQKEQIENINVEAVNFPNDLVHTLNAGQVVGGGTGWSEWSLFSYLARVNYSYDSKYLLTASMRRDGSSRFGADNRWGSFPSVSVGWNISEEDFMRSLGFVSDLKLRASYGHAGNNTIGNYNSIGLLGASRYILGNSIVNGLGPNSLSNLDLGWEVMKQTDIGLDIGLFGNRLSFIIDYFDKTTSDLLLDVPVPGSTGFSSALQNIGKISNKGWEFTVSSKNLAGDFKWNTDFNISFYKNKVLALGPSGDPIISRSRSFSPQTHITQIGMPMASFYGYDAIGVYLDQADIDKSPVVPGGAGSKPGDLKFRDVDGDGVITANDRTIIGSNHPDFAYGMTNSFSYKNFSLSVLIDGVEGIEVLNGSRRNISFVSFSYSRRDVLGRWQSPENPGDGRTPRANLVPTGGNYANVSSFLVEDASFLRIRNINLKYNLPQKVFGKLPVRSGTAFFSVQNAHTFTKYKGYNPEQNVNGADPLTPGVDFNGYPLARVFTLGLNFTFQ